MEELYHPLLKVPFESANKSFRLFHKHVTREVTAFQKAIDGLHEHPQTTDDTITALTAMSEQIRNVQHETKRFIAEQEKNMQSSINRTLFIQQAPPTRSQRSEIEESDVKTTRGESNIHHDRLITDYLLGAGHVKSAQLLMETKEIESLVDYELHLECRAIWNDLQAHNLSTAITWCNENGSRLRRLQSQLEFKLRLQAFIELVRSDCKLEAIQYAQSHLTPLSMQYEDVVMQKSMMEAIQEAMATLAYKIPTSCGAESYARLFSAERWEILQEAFRTTFCEVYGIHNPSSLWIALYAGLSSLNTRMCRRTREAWEAERAVHATNGASADGVQADETNGEGRREISENKRHNDESQSPQRNKKSKLIKFQEIMKAEASSSRKHHMVKTKNHKEEASLLVEHVAPPLCPTCSDVGSQLVEGLPFAHHPHSRLVCRITETVMDHRNPPFVLPNGHVYSRQAIDRLVKDTIFNTSNQLLGSKLSATTSRSSNNHTNSNNSTTALSTHGIITCPETQEIYSIAELKPVFII